MLKLTASESIQLGFILLSNFIVIIVMNPWSMISLAALICVIGFLYVKVIPATREARRNELILKSPIFSEYTTSLAGITSVRCYGY
jgi:ATP-binding cassette subfamily C (CFTR/MRP) protein 4